MSETTTKKITLFLAQDVHRRAKVRLAEEGLSFQGKLTELLTEWAVGVKPSKVTPMPSRTPQPEQPDDPDFAALCERIRAYKTGDDADVMFYRILRNQAFNGHEPKTREKPASKKDKRKGA